MRPLLLLFTHVKVIVISRVVYPCENQVNDELPHHAGGSDQRNWPACAFLHMRSISITSRVSQIGQLCLK